MAYLPMSVTFLGTSSGGGPSDSRNCSSLLTHVQLDGSLWMVDCAEGTLRQFSRQPNGLNRLKVSRVSKIFITHMHADHTMGLVPLLRNILGIPKFDTDPSPKPPKVEVYGPAGIRLFVRSILKMTFTRTADRYVVHELLSANDEVTPCVPPEVMHTSESQGRDIRAGKEDGFWREFVSRGNVAVDAGPILHRDPCIGYIIRESPPFSRKIVILGDTHDPKSLLPLCVSPSPSLLIHESTDAYIPSSIDPNSKRTKDNVETKARERGHSTPGMAGTFAKLTGAKQLVLNHIGSRFPAPQNANRRRLKDTRVAVMQEVERQASEAWGMGTAQAAVDYMRVEVNAIKEPDWKFDGGAITADLGRTDASTAGHGGSKY